MATRVLMNASPRLGSQVLFVAGRSWTADDAVAFASFRGSLQRAIDETLALSAAEDRVADDDLVISSDALQISSERFRYEHDLISAGETESWLAARGMTIDDFSGWLYQRLCRTSIDGAALSEPLPIPDAFPDLLRVNLWLSGEMDAIAEQLRHCIAADRELAARGEAVFAHDGIRAFMEREAFDDASLREWLDAVGRDASWLDEIARLDVAHERLAATIATEAARSRKFESMRRSFSTVKFDLLEVDSPGVAREAFLCVHDDRLPLADVARDAGFPVLRREVSMEDLGALADRLVSAADGAVVGPVETEGRFRLYQVLGKRSPSLADPLVRKRIDALILDEYFSELAARHVQPPRPTPIS